MNFPRQAEPIHVDFHGDLRDVDYYMRVIKRAIEARGYDDVEIMGNQMKIYPQANND